MKRNTLLTIALVALMLTAGCAGWGEDGVHDPDAEDDSNADEQEQEQQENQDGSGDKSDDSTDSTDSSESDDGSESTDSSDTSESEESGESDKSGDSSDSSDTTESNESNDTTESTESTDTTSGTVDDNTDESDDSSPSESDGDSEPAGDSSEPDESDTNENDSDEDTADEPEEDPEVHILTVTVGEAVPVEDVDITLERHSDGATTTRATDSDGKVEFRVIDGDYTVSGTDTNDDSDSADVTVDGEDTEVLLDGLAPKEPETVTLNVTVTDAETGEPIEGAQVDGVGNWHPNTGDQLMSVSTGADGTGSSEVFEGGYAANAYADGYEEWSGDIDASEDPSNVEIELEPEESETEMHEQSATVTVVNDDGDPIEGIPVMYGPPGESPNEETLTDSNGEARITSVTSDPSDVTMLDVTVNGETKPAHAEVGGTDGPEFVIPSED